MAFRTTISGGYDESTLAPDRGVLVHLDLQGKNHLNTTREVVKKIPGTNFPCKISELETRIVDHNSALMHLKHLSVDPGTLVKVDKPKKHQSTSYSSRTISFT